MMRPVFVCLFSLRKAIFNNGFSGLAGWFFGVFAERKLPAMPRWC